VRRFLAKGAATIIPLAPASRPGSSDLPEGSSFRAACATRKGACSFEFAQRAGPALPSYLVLHHAGFALPRTLLPERWALTPPFHPYLRRVPFEDIPKVFLRAITGIRHAGGIFSVALSVNSSTGFSLRLPCNTHRLKSALPLPWHYQARCPCFGPVAPRLRPASPFAKWCPDFPPAPPLAQLGQRSSSSPAISIISWFVHEEVGSAPA
jgi:hypothetical protein